MSDEQWLREGLRKSVPEPPQSPRRAAIAVSRAGVARRRTTILVAAGSALAVLAVIGGALLLPAPGGAGPTDRSTVGGPLPDSNCPPATANPRDPEFFDEPQAGLPDAVPVGATSARLCAGNGHLLEPPRDALTSGVDELVDAVNALPRAQKEIVCTQELGYGYRIVFGYSDGSGYEVMGQLYGCEFVVVGSEQRMGAADLLKTYGSLLRQQREQIEPPALNDGIADTIPCGSRLHAPAIALPQDLHLAVLCVRARDGFLRSKVSTGDLGILRDDLSHNMRRAGFPRCANATDVTLVGLTKWGELVALPSVCGTSQLQVLEPWSTSTWPRSWLPGQAAQQILIDLTERAS